MAVSATRQGTVTSEISQLAYALLAGQRAPLVALQTRLSDLNKRSSVLGTLKTRLLALHDEAQVLARGLTYYRDSNTVTDLLNGVTVTLKSTSASAVTLKIQPDADGAVNEIKTFISKYNDALDYLKQQPFIDAKARTRGPLAGDSTYLLLPGQIRATEATVVQSQAARTPNTLAGLGITAGDDGKLAITDETKLRDTFTANPGSVQSLFNASDGVATQLMAFVDRYSSFSGLIVGSQSAVTSQISFVNDRIGRLQASLDKKQTTLEQQLARQQAMLNQLAQQQAQIQNFMNRGF